jgi:hypothetical protein
MNNHPFLLEYNYHTIPKRPLNLHSASQHLYPSIFMMPFFFRINLIGIIPYFEAPTPPPWPSITAILTVSPRN